MNERGSIKEYLKENKSIPREYRENLEKHIILLGNIKQKIPKLEGILKRTDEHWGEEDLIYRFYHESYKVYRIQDMTRKIYLALEDISPHIEKKIRDPHFIRVFEEGASGRKWKLEDNKNWDKVCRPFLEAFWHSKYFLEMAVKYGKELDEAPRMLPSGWAALLELYGIR